MKKMVMFAAAVMLAVVTNAATVAWTSAGMTNYKNDAYQIFVIGQQGVESVAMITALLDAGSDTSAYAFGSGVVSATGLASNTNSGKNLDAGTYTSFMVLFDAATVGDASNYVVLSGAATQTQTFTATAAKVTFGAGNVSGVVNDTANWKSYGGDTPGVPEPTSGLLLLVGGAMLALRRKQK